MESLASKYRPHKFSDVCSQVSIVKILTRQLETKTTKNCYLFAGSSGCGKTTIARIFANDINKGIGLPIEIDAASNNGVDNIRELVRSASERSLSGEYKIYIVDECHALTNQSWQALLKTIEEPPRYTIFIFCTTDVQKVPDTILNRCQRFNFNRIDSATIFERLKYISQQEHFINYEDTCDYISRICKGGMRDAIALLEKCASYSSDLSMNNCLTALGNYSYDIYFKLINMIIDGNEQEVLRIIADLYNEGNNLKIFAEQFLSFCIDLNKYVIFNDYKMTSIPVSEVNNMNKACKFEGANNYYHYVINKLLELKNMIKNDTDIRSTVEVMLLNITRLE